MKKAQNYLKNKIYKSYILKLLFAIALYIYNKCIYNEKYFFAQPEYYQRNILDKIQYGFKGHLVMGLKELYFVNGLIRMFKPKKILEIGVCAGAMSAAILNSIKDIKDSMLYSCDLEKRVYVNNKYEVGYIVKKNFPELLNKWKLFTGNTTASFIEEIGGNIDFVFIDTAHVMPGEVLNLIEILPFLKDNAIIALDDINQHIKQRLIKLPFFHSCNHILFSVLRGKKIILNEQNKTSFDFFKQGAVILDKNQKRYYFDYFFLLTNNWSYMPNQFEIKVIRELIKKYYSSSFLFLIKL